ncbi:MAG: hypothetical protein ACW9W4_07780 [Candidatus Nitrosopumilus sp. bin_7KS]
MSLLKNPKRLAKLLASVNVTHSDRPLGPIDTAEEIKELLSELHNDKNELVNRLPISLDMVKAFLRLLELPMEIQDIVIWGQSKQDTGEISFTSAQELVKLNSSEDILKLVSAIHSVPRPVTKDEVKGIISLKNRNSKKTIDDCITEVLNVTRPVVIQHFLFISGIQPSIVQSLKIASEKSSKNLNEFALEIISKVFPSQSVKGIKVHDDYVRLSLSKDGREFIRSYIDKNNLLRKDLIDDIFSKEGF